MVIKGNCELLALAENDKENMESALAYSSLGHIVKDVWGGRVRKVNRGPRGKRQYVFLNLKKKAATVSEPGVSPRASITQILSGLTVPAGWTTVLNEHDESTSFIRLERWEIDKWRGSTEVIVKGLRNDFNITITSHGCETNGFTEEALNRSSMDKW